MIVADASALIAFLDADDEHHERAISAFIDVDQFFVHPITLAEVLVHPARHGQATGVMARLAAIGMAMSPAPLDPLALAGLRASSRLKMPDCIVVVTARYHGLPLLTFDDRIRRAVAE